MRSYIGDIGWLNYSAFSISESIACHPDVLRTVHLVVPPPDVPAFNQKLDEIWSQRNLEPELRERWVVWPSKVHIIDSGSQEQMLDKMHTDLYSDAAFVVYLDTDTVLGLELTREMLVDDVGKPYLCHRDVAGCGKDCETWMQNFVRLMMGEGEHLSHEFMCRLGQAYPMKVFQVMRKTVAAFKGPRWEAFVQDALAQGAQPWTEDDPAQGFTEFNCMGAVLWRDYHEHVHWVRIDWMEMGFRSCPQQTWSWETSEDTLAKVVKQFECLEEHLHDAPLDTPFECNARRTKCKQQAGV
jgi:hypothetical protein